MPSSSAAFLPGLELARALYEDGVRPVLAERYPHLRYAAARIGSGSEVLGFDTLRSVDHEWGPQLQLFLAPGDAAQLADEIRRLLAHRLPEVGAGLADEFSTESGSAGPGRSHGADPRPRRASRLRA